MWGTIGLALFLLPLPLHCPRQLTRIPSTGPSRDRPHVPRHRWDGLLKRFQPSAFLFRGDPGAHLSQDRCQRVHASTCTYKSLAPPYHHDAVEETSSSRRRNRGAYLEGSGSNALDTNRGPEGGYGSRPHVIEGLSGPPFGPSPKEPSTRSQYLFYRSSPVPLFFFFFLQFGGKAEPEAIFVISASCIFVYV